ncbi:Penicillinase repressor [Symmachiella dynata]|uniref:BlaI/MecI/CopY family transcriptional regulator n=1 Tax=Symmachiella dynata TaxID=2527995 RepID=UPI001188EF73|nr:BlaI/MecI/CopY family transcriptional regulator [Symmachiella dynata]QDT50516.1 Penicillinase repressor [Symmachiella dynata]
MKKRPALSKGEMEVARVLWELGEATVRQVHKNLPADRNIDFVTVQTYLRRLAAKGYLRTTTQGRIKVYHPKVKPQTVIRESVSDFVSRLFDGESLPLVRHLIEERGISNDDIDELRSLLDRLKKENS